MGLEPDVWFYSKEKIANEGDTVLIKVKAESNTYGVTQAVSQGKAPWGGSGWFLSGWIFLLPGFLMFLAGVTISIIGLIGKADRSMERLLEEDKEFRRQQLMLREAARKQMQAQQKQQQWSAYSGSPEGPPPDPQNVVWTEDQTQEGQAPEGSIEGSAVGYQGDQAPRFETPGAAQMQVPIAPQQYRPPQTPPPDSASGQPMQIPQFVPPQQAPVAPQQQPQGPQAGPAPGGAVPREEPDQQ